MDNTLLDKVLIARTMYNAGLSYMSDAEYDTSLMELKNQGVTLDPIYEDDDVPYESFSRIMGLSVQEVESLLAPTNTAVPTAVFGSPKRMAYDLLAETESLSITPVFSFEDAYNWFRAHRDLEIVISPKIDGINTRRGYMREGDKLCFVASLTRGRKSAPLDVTANMQYISPSVIERDLGPSLLVYSETVTTKAAVDIMNEKYKAAYTLPRGLAISMMRTDRFSEDDYQYLRSFVFRVDYGAKLSEGLDMAKMLGFEVVPYVLYTFKGETFESFVSEMQKVIVNLKQYADGIDIVTDGMVAEVNDRGLFSAGSVNNNYSSANLAMKIGLWQPGVYSSIVRSLDLTQQAERCTCVAIVDPVVTKGGQTVTRVNCFNPSVLFANHILPGAEISFEYKNETTVNLIV